MLKDIGSLFCSAVLVFIVAVFAAHKHTVGENVLLAAALTFWLYGFGLVLLVGVIIGGFRSKWRWAAFTVSAVCVSAFLWCVPARPNKPDSAKPATTSRLHSESHWRGLADPER